MSRLVLIVQEDSNTLETLMEIFMDQGDRVVSANSLKDAGRAVEHHKPDVIVMDVHLFGRAWQTAIPKIAQRLPDTEILYTANGASIGNDAAEEHGKWGVLCAPFSADKIDQALRERSMRYPAQTEGVPPQPKRSKIRFPIRLKITLPYVMLALFIAMVAAYVVTRVVFDTIEERFTNQLIETGKLASEWMVKEENRNLETLRLISHAIGIPEAVQGRDAEQLRQLLYPLAVNAGVDAVEILDPEGISVFSLRHPQGADVEDYTVSKGDEGYRTWMFVYSVLDGHADVIGDKYAGVAKAPWGAYFYTAGPIFDSEQNLVGVALVGTSLETIVKQIREVTLAQVTIYSLEGQALATTFLEDAPALTPLMASDVLSRQDYDSYSRNLGVANISYGEILGPLEVRLGNDVGLIGTSLPQTFLVRASSVTRVQILVISALTLVVVIIVGIVLSDRITRPLLRIVRASTEVARGNLRIRVGAGGNDEVAALANTFNHMVTELEQSSDNLLLAYDLTIEGWSKALEMRNRDTKGHTQRVTELTLELARSMGLGEEELLHVRRGALLHDIGKMAIPDSVLNKQGPLTDEEWVIMRKHPIYAHQMLSPIPYLRPALDIPCCHHERWDGRGYPNGLQGEDIPLAARIFAVVDVWDALTSDRSYRPAWPKQDALDYIIKNKGKHFDPQVVARFVKTLGIDKTKIVEMPERPGEFKSKKETSIRQPAVRKQREVA